LRDKDLADFLLSGDFSQIYPSSVFSPNPSTICGAAVADKYY